jgi:feruloyl esterase
MFDAVTPLIHWVETGVPPERLVASRLENKRVARTRALCSYPQVARYAGHGSIDDAGSFVCQRP